MTERKPGDIPLPQGFLEDLATALGGIEPDRVVLFGSSTSQGLEARDLDVLVLSEAFEGVAFGARHELLDLPKGPSYDLRLYTPTEFERLCPRGHPFRESIERDNVEIVAGSEVEL